MKANHRVYFLFLLFALVTLKSFGQTKVNEQEIYEFLNSITNHDSIGKFNLSSEPDFQRVLMDTASIFDDSIFTSADIVFIKEQIISSRKFKWTQGKILGAKVIDTRKLNLFYSENQDGYYDEWEKYHKEHKGEGGFYTYSIPLFSSDKEKCIVSRGKHCGALCGFGKVILYRKIKGKWEIAEEYTSWKI